VPEEPILPDDWAEAWSTMSSRAFMAWMRDRGVTAPHVELLGYEVVTYDVGSCELTWTVPRSLLNPANIAHGGFLAAILDDACGMSIASSYDRWVPQLTVNLNVDYLAPVHADVEHRVHGRLVRRGRSTSLADATITDPDGTLCARASGVFQPNRRMVPRAMWAEAGLA
jgi:uncharacterized protein (TIGR00369 family)